MEPSSIVAAFAGFMIGSILTSIINKKDDFDLSLEQSVAFPQYRHMYLNTANNHVYNAKHINIECLEKTNKYKISKEFVKQFDHRVYMGNIEFKNDTSLDELIGDCKKCNVNTKIQYTDELGKVKSSYIYWDKCIE